MLSGILEKEAMARRRALSEAFGMDRCERRIEGDRPGVQGLANARKEAVDILASAATKWGIGFLIAASWATVGAGLVGCGGDPSADEAAKPKLSDERYACETMALYAKERLSHWASELSLLCTIDAILSQPQEMEQCEAWKAECELAGRPSFTPPQAEILCEDAVAVQGFEDCQPSQQVIEACVQEYSKTFAAVDCTWDIGEMLDSFGQVCAELQAECPRFNAAYWIAI